MGLKEKIKDFNLRDNEGIDKDDNNGKISEAFKPIAETILSGHFKVTKNNSDSYVTVHPTCVEMYYHEEGEGEDKIKDYIVYHRDSNDGKNKKDIFPLGVLHNHVSGIDLTFEREGNDHEPIRFSDLIREFWVNMENKKDKEDKYEMKGIDGSSENKPDNKPTHLYDALYSQFSVFDGFSVKWEDGKEKKEIRCIGTRINVSEYILDNNKLEKAPKVDDVKLNTLNKKYKQCQRMWRYSINEDKTK